MNTLPVSDKNYGPGCEMCESKTRHVHTPKRNSFRPRIEAPDVSAEVFDCSAEEPAAIIPDERREDLLPGGGSVDFCTAMANYCGPRVGRDDALKTRSAMHVFMHERAVARNPQWRELTKSIGDIRQALDGLEAQLLGQSDAEESN